MRFESNYVQKQQQKQSMKLAMTQQLSQSIAMLQFTTADLTTFLEDKALENPLIEVVAGIDVATDYSYTKRKKNYDTDNDWLEQIADSKETLPDFLKNQIALMKLSYKEKIVLLYLVESLNDAGYLVTDIETIASGLLMSEADVLAGLEVLQSLEPAGVGARDAKECILLQIDRSIDAPYIAYDVISEHFTAFAEKKWKSIASALDVPLSEIQQVSDFVQTLNPKPGSEFETERVQYVVPDLILQQVGQELFVSVAKQFIPQIRFQENYYKMMRDTNEKDVLNFLKDKTGEYDWLMKGMEQREDTLKRVGKAIVAHQKAHFLENAHLEPLTLKEIAEEIGVHESTVSRAVNGKYIETSQGVFELKSFFASGLQKKKETATDTGDVSSASIKQLILDFVKEEDKRKPLSDQKIVDLLAEKGIEVSRRAIAKYRTELRIPSSSKRKRFDE
ncbi:MULTISPECIES: RNA polymerase factor sigma-54 [unclassified Listeria]|uniref:RNA polymerase factor sigma-54 n=1 Tax=unclassified Listeria TaxID=2642072 RepID=UPI000B5939E9|nr:MULTISPECIES: RNA polymerase factor sigma-54 [unclassified Listeria]